MRRHQIADEFSSRFGHAPEYYVQAPGRVNLIGEHTDYNGFPVIPISIPFTINAAVSARRDNRISIANLESSYAPSAFDIEKEIPPSPSGHWANYVKAAVSQLATEVRSNLHGMDALFEGNIPASAGLSSSSALVIASALSLLAANSLKLPAIELAEMMAEGERYVGTQGGGMDQAICLLGQEGKSVKIDFFPLRCSYFPFPGDYSIIVAHSLIRAAKTENALVKYNRRPAECRLAAAMINSLYPVNPLMKRLGDLPRQEFYTGFKNIEDFIEATFPCQSYSLKTIAHVTGDTTEFLTMKYLLTRNGIPMPEPEDGFHIRQRVLHILTEADRVEMSCEALRNRNTDLFGRLMNESHVSCDVHYGISTPELNALVSIMRDAGALGARLTGAGFGGCAIALADDSDILKIMEAVQELYYGKYLTDTRPELAKGKSGEDIVFSAKPSRGASVQPL
ncbi:MAG: galactokinase [Candidatus Latescibacter sp.]|nr:galactokinase [Candidatus Latescibacter sp.]